MEPEQHYNSWLSRKDNEVHPQSFPLQHSSKAAEQTSDEDQMVKELGKLLAAARRRAFVIFGVTVAVSAALLFRISKRPPIYSGTFQLLVEPVTTSESRLQALVTETEGNKFATINGRDFSLDYATQIRVLKSPKVMAPIMKNIKAKYSDVKPADIWIQRPFDENEGTRILAVGYSDGNPKKVRFILEQVAEGYLTYSRESRLTNLRQAIQFVEEQIPALRQRVDTLQEQLQKLREKYDLLNPDFQGKKLVEQSNFIETKRIQTEADLLEARSRYLTLKKLFDEGNMSAVLSQDLGAYAHLIKQIHEVQAETTAAAARLQEEHPNLKALREHQQNLRRQSIVEAQSLLEKVAGEFKALEKRQQHLVQAENAIAQRFQVLPAVTRQHDDLERELKVASETLNQYLSKLDGLRIDAAQQEVPWELIAPPGRPQPASAASRKTKILTVIVGLVLGIGTAFLLEILNNVFHSPEDIEDETGLPLLGAIPLSKELKKVPRKSNARRKKVLPVGVGSGSNSGTLPSLVSNYDIQTRSYDVSPFLEAFRSFYTNIRLLSPERPLHSLVIGAATPGEGKSSVAVHLAQTAATIGQRVLLVDADLRNPKIHIKLGLPNMVGLSNAISTDLSLNEAIQKSPMDDNLFVLTAGQIPNHPVKLLSSKKMHSLMEQFQDFFDLVIYDTPPLIGLADASILAAQTDGLILVVKVDKTERSLVSKAVDRLHISGSFVLGIVANCVKE